MKKRYFFLGFIVILVSLVFIFPQFLKHKLKDIVIEEFDKKVDAQLYFKDVNVSVFGHFPHIAVGLNDIYIIGNRDFKNDTLFASKQLTIAFDVNSLIQGKEILIKRVHLTQPYIHLKTLSDGTSNYNLLRKDSSKNEQSEKKPSKFHTDVDKWEIVDAKIILDDKRQKIYLELGNLNHSGSGDFKQDISDLSILTKANELTFHHKNIKYFHKKRFSADILIEMNLKEKKFTFKDHAIEINHFKFSFDGFFKILPKGFDVDLEFKIKETPFLNLLSIMPGIYLHQFENLKTDGTFAFDGHAKGILDLETEKIPNFQCNLIINNGFFKFNHLPKAIQHINIKASIENLYGILDSTKINIPRFHFDIHENYFKGYLKLHGWTKKYIETELKTNLKLDELEEVFPIPNLVLKGVLNADIQAKGFLDDSMKVFPTIDAKIKLKEGYIQDKNFPIAIENLQLEAEAIGKGKLDDFQLSLYQMNYSLDNEPFEMKGKLQNLLNPQYDLNVKGTIDFEKLTKIFTIPSTTICGLMRIDVETSGKLSDIQAKDYQKITNIGSLALKNIVYENENITEKIKITDAKLNFNPDKIILEEFKGIFGKANISLTGHLFNYLGIVSHDETYLKGDLNLICDSLDVNEWMSKEDNSNKNQKQFTIPRNFDFVFDSKIDHIKYNQLNITEILGEIRIKDGILNLNETGFNAAGANFKLTGNYNTQNIYKPTFDLNIEIVKLELLKAFLAFQTSTITSAEMPQADGFFTTKYQLEGILAPNNLPVYESLKGKGTIIIDKAQIKGMKVLNHVSKITKKKEMADPTLEDIVMETEIKNGKIFIKPFTFKFGAFLTELEGIHSFKNEMNYILRISIPPFHKIKIPFHISGTGDKPVVKIGKGHEKFDFNQVPSK